MKILCHPERSEGSLKEHPIIFGFFLIFIFILFSNPSHAAPIPPQVCHLDHCVTVEVVSKQDDLERGLMYRLGLEQNTGMLFKFSTDGIQQFWMKNMHFNLDILWISADGHIVYVGQNIPACTTDPCPVYTPDKLARYVLELASGYTASHHWSLGDKLDFKGI